MNDANRLVSDNIRVPKSIEYSMVEFEAFAHLQEEIASISSINAKVNLLSEWFKSLQADEIGYAALFSAGRVFAENDPRSLNISWKGIKRSLRRIVSFSAKKLEEFYDGDIGEAVRKVLKRKATVRQLSLAGERLTVKSTADVFQKIAETTGKGSKKEKENLLAGLFNDASPLETKYIVALILNDTRTGVSDGLVIEAVAKAFEIDSDDVRRGWALSGSISEVAQVACSQGAEGVESIDIELMRPVKPMLATAIDFDALSDDIEKQFSIEYKYDGARIQIHKKGDIIQIYSRRLKEVTGSLPEIVRSIGQVINNGSVILDGEVIAVSKEGRPYPFQVVMERFGRVEEISKKAREISLRTRLFDILYLDDESLVDLPYHKRRKLLEKIVKDDILAPKSYTNDVGEIRDIFKESQQKGHEGIVLKNPDSSYVPGKRGKHWLKLKHTLETLDLVIIAAEWGHGRRSNWLSDYHLAVLDEENGEFLGVGKTFKGLTDEEFQDMTDRLLEIEVHRKGNIVEVKPEIVVEVLASEIQRSPNYESQLALRFARIVSTREDKNPSDATTLRDFEAMYEKQFEYKARSR